MDNFLIMSMLASGVLIIWSGKRAFDRVSYLKGISSDERRILRYQLAALGVCLLGWLGLLIYSRLFPNLYNPLTDPLILILIWPTIGYLAASSYSRKVSIIGWIRAIGKPTRGKPAQTFGIILFITLLVATARLVLLG